VTGVAQPCPSPPCVRVAAAGTVGGSGAGSRGAWRGDAARRAARGRILARQGRVVVDARIVNSGVIRILIMNLDSGSNPDS